MEFVTYKNSTKPNGVAYVRFVQGEEDCCKVALEYLQPADEAKEEVVEEVKESDKKMEEEDDEQKRKDGE